MMCQFHCSIHGEELKKEDNEMQQWCVSTIKVSVEKSCKRRKEGVVMMCQCCCSTHGEEDHKKRWPTSVLSMLNISQSYQRTYSWLTNICGKELIAHPKTNMNYWDWMWMMIIQQMQPPLLLLQMTSSLLMTRLKWKDRKPWRKKAIHQGWILWFLSKTKEEFLINNELIDVTTKSWSNLDEMWRYHNTPQFTMMRKWMMI